MSFTDPQHIDYIHLFVHLVLKSSKERLCILVWWNSGIGASGGCSHLSTAVSPAISGPFAVQNMSFILFKLLHLAVHFLTRMVDRRLLRLLILFNLRPVLLRIIQIIVVVHRLRLTVIGEAERHLLLLWLKDIILLLQAKAVYASVHFLHPTLRVLVAILHERVVVRHLSIDLIV